MINVLGKIYQSVKTSLTLSSKINAYFDVLAINQGVLLSSIISGKKDYRSLAELEFKVFSQFGDDGIIQYLTQNIQCEYRTFIEFGVGDYFESNTRFLLQKDNWSGFVMDGSTANIQQLKKAPFYWKHDLDAQAEFITKENISELLNPYFSRWGGVDLLHIDLDGNDYWIWEAIKIKPNILILEYNSLFGFDRAITVPYNPSFNRTSAHFSNLYWGASLKALYGLSQERGYTFIGCNSHGNNAYFLRKDKVNDRVKEVSLEEGFVLSKYREARDKAGALTCLRGEERPKVIRGLPVFNIDSQMIEEF
jgi:hypothetical protein